MSESSSHATGDPLVREPAPLGHKIGFVSALVAAALVLHVVATAGISGASWVIGLGGGYGPIEDEPVEVEVIEAEDDEDETEDETEDEAEDETLDEETAEAEEAEEEEIEEEKVEDEKPKKTKQPPPDPINQPKEDSPPPKKAPQRIVGLELESTVSGGDGPAYATGNTRMGKTKRKAADPRKVEPVTSRQPPPPRDPPKVNRKATNIPGSKAVIVKPKRAQKIKPEYPKMLRARGIEGTVVVRVSLDKEGRVTKVEIIAPAKEPEFNAAARAAALQERFQPATKDGVAIPFSLSFSYRFRLSD